MTPYRTPAPRFIPRGFIREVLAQLAVTLLGYVVQSVVNWIASRARGKRASGPVGAADGPPSAQQLADALRAVVYLPLFDDSGGSHVERHMLAMANARDVLKRHIEHVEMKQ